MGITAEQIEQLGRFEQLQLAEDLWDRFASDAAPETDPAVLDELERRARWRDAHPAQGKTLAEIAQGLGVRL
ncbi:MAG: addiction module protein [Acidovorax sp.]|uniref:addiction module protein n=1 Tax=Acidovorax sp. TaxID=1872122 RepID=UPI0039E6A834